MVNARTAFATSQEALERLAASETSETALARNKFLRVVGGALFGAAASVFLPRPDPADAHCPADSNHPCFGFPLCQPTFGCSNGTANCCANNVAACLPECNTGYHGCPSGDVCWVSCHNGQRIRCCDCDNGSRLCICRYVVGTC